MDYIVDTSYLVGLWRRQAWALKQAREEPKAQLGLCWVVYGEFLHGARRAGYAEGLVTGFLEIGLPIVEAGSHVGAYADICCALQESGRYGEVGQNDMWIGAVARTWGKPVLSRNRRHFSAMPGVEVKACG